MLYQIFEIFFSLFIVLIITHLSQDHSGTVRFWKIRQSAVCVRNHSQGTISAW